MATSGKKVKARKAKTNDKQQRKMVRTLDALAEYDKFNEALLPQLRKMVLENWPAEKIRKHFAPYMQAQMIQKGMAGDFKAIKDTLDRHEGTAVQRIEQKTTLQQMTRQELAALAIQKFKDAGMIDAECRVVRDTDENDNKK